MNKLLSFGFLTTIGALFFYTFTQIDLNLTLSQVSVWQDTQKAFQQIGYFNRPLSTYLYIAIVLVLTVFYVLFIKEALKNKLDKKHVFTLIFVTTVLLSFSYNAFSYDLFNYIFDAKIVTYYNQNPYEHKALDYLSDPMVNFMRWTHRYYPYGPTWLLLTVPLSLIGLQYFLPTFFLFKFFMAACFLGSVYFIGKIVKITNPTHEVLGIVLFGLNPLILVESLVSAHNDIVMIFLLLASVCFLLSKQYIRSYILLILSVGVKFATVFLLPVFVGLHYFLITKKHINFKKFVFLSAILMTAAVLVASNRTQYQPWYLLYIIPIFALYPTNKLFIVSSVVLSLFSLLQYVPFLYTGNWNPPIPTILMWISILGIVCTFLIVIIWNKGINKKLLE